MPIVLVLETGPHSGQRIVIPDGGSTTVGRSSKAQHALPNDTFLSGAHFAVESTPGGVIVRDLNSVNGTFVNSIRVPVALLQPGLRIGAGQTLFAVYFEEKVEQEQAAAGDPGDPTPAQRRLLEILNSQREPLFVILDAARDPLILGVVRVYAEEHQSLYEGRAAQDLVDVAPYLCSVPPQSLLMGQVVRNWGKSWGVLLTAALPLARVREHVRQFLRVQTEGGEDLGFRFYDPRVLRVFLRACNADEAKSFVGPLRSWISEDEDPDKLLRFTCGAKGIDTEELALTPVAGAPPVQGTAPRAQL